MSSLLYFGVKVEQYFVSSSCIFLDIKTLLKVWLNPGLMLTISRGTGPWPLRNYVIITSIRTPTKKIFLKSISNSHISLSFVLI